MLEYPAWSAGCLPALVTLRDNKSFRDQKYWFSKITHNSFTKQ